MHERTRRRLALHRSVLHVCSLVILAALTGCASRGTTTEPLRIAPLDGGPVWVSKAAWDHAEEHVVVADPVAGAIYVFGRDGKTRRRIEDDGSRERLDFSRPNYATRVGDRYLIMASFSGWVWFDRGLVPQEPFDLEWEAGAGAYAEIDASEFAVSDTDVYVIGTPHNADGQWSEKAIFAISRRDRTAQQIGRLPIEEESRSYYNEPPFNLAACGGKLWLLEMAPQVSIREARDGGLRLRSFPADLARRPELPVLECAGSVAPRREALRKVSIAEGLFCDGDRLLLLAHKPRVDTGTQWLVYPIDPARDVMGEPFELPSTADEIVFVPGRRRWAVLEKGAMQHIGNQPLTRILSFPPP